MKYAIKHLREELNRERSYESQFHYRAAKGHHIRQGSKDELFRRRREHRIPSLENAIVMLKKYKNKPQYYWQLGNRYLG